jgi:hypothetical protein
LKSSAVIWAVLAAVCGCAHQRDERLPAAGARPAAAASAWRVIESQHFAVRTDAAPSAYLPLIQRLEDVHQALSATFFAGVPLPRVQVLLFARARDYRAVAPDNLVGFFTSSIDGFEDGLLVFPAEGRDFAAVASTAAHELAHQFLHAVGERIPTWLHEGFAKYVGALEVHGDVLAFDAAAVTPSFALSRPVPLGRLYASASNDFHGADARAQYLTAWMLVRRLLDHPDATLFTRFRKLLGRSALSPAPEAQAAAVSEAFGGLPPAHIEHAVLAAHHALAGGWGPAPARETVAVTLRRPARPPHDVGPADPDAIQALCLALRQRSRPRAADAASP